jgi:hypothetical protein
MRGGEGGGQANAPVTVLVACAIGREEAESWQRRWDPPRHVLLDVYAVKLGQVAVNVAILKHGHLFELLELFLQRRRLGREVPSTKRGAACAVSGAVFGARLWMV